MLQALLNLFKFKKKETVEPVVEPAPLPPPPVEIKIEVNSQITDAVTQTTPSAENPKKSRKPRQSKKK